MCEACNTHNDIERLYRIVEILSRAVRDFSGGKFDLAAELRHTNLFERPSAKPRMFVVASKPPEKTDDVATQGVTLSKTLPGMPDTDLSTFDACTGSGHLRSVNVNGTCFCQICCGGQWQYVIYTGTDGKQYGQTCGMNGLTVSCDGHSYISRC